MGEGKDKSAPRTVVKPAWPRKIRTERKKCNVPQRRLPLLTFQVKRERERESQKKMAPCMESKKVSSLSHLSSCISRTRSMGSDGGASSTSCSVSSSPKQLSPGSLAFYSRFHSQVRSVMLLFQKKESHKQSRDLAPEGQEKQKQKQMQRDGGDDGDGGDVDYASENGEDNCKMEWLNAYADATYNQCTWLSRQASQDLSRSNSGWSTGRDFDAQAMLQDALTKVKLDEGGLARDSSPFLHYQKRRSSGRVRCSTA